MKLKIAILIASLIGGLSVSKAQQPPKAACMTNCCIQIVDPHAWLVYNGGAYSEKCELIFASDGNCWDPAPALTITADYCASSNTVVAVVTIQCDPNTACGGGEGGGTCGTGGSFPITLPQDMDSVSIELYSLWGCCSLTYCIHGMTQCSQPIGSDIPPIP